MADPLMTIFWTLLFTLYLCHLRTRVQLEFNSHLTGDPRSTEIANDYSPSYDVLPPYPFYRPGVKIKRVIAILSPGVKIMLSGVKNIKKFDL